VRGELKLDKPIFLIADWEFKYFPVKSDCLCPFAAVKDGVCPMEVHEFILQRGSCFDYPIFASL